MPELLFEVGLEEIPARMIAAAQSELGKRVEALLVRESLCAPGFSVESYSTPRRLAVKVGGVLGQQADVEEILTGPSWNVAFRNGEPTPAAHAFAKKVGVEVSALAKTTTPKGEYVTAAGLRKGQAAAAVLAAQLPKELAALYWPKNMYWRAGKPERFVRPLRWLLAILDSEVVPVRFAGTLSGNKTYGHRILHGDEPIEIANPSEYLTRLEAAFVLPDVEARRHKIRKALDAAARSVPGIRWREDHELVDAVTHLTEWPSAVLGSFEAEYLTLPEEVLVTVMRDHQKYFALEGQKSDNGGKSGSLSPYFLAVLNTQSDPRGEAIIRHGNERVLRSRFKDARFFWDFDQKVPLVDRVEMLKSVTFQKELGSYFEKTQSTAIIAGMLADFACLRGAKLEKAALLQAAELAKTDLTAELVKEFPELQGIIGGLYAGAQGLGDAVRQAIYWQYSPASNDDPIPPTTEGQLLGLADRICSIVDMFAIGLRPTGSKDPFALRRAASGIVKVLAESLLPITLEALVHVASQASSQRGAAAAAPIIREFLRERLDFYLRENRGFNYDVVAATLAAGDDNIPDAIARARALTAVRGSEDFAAIAAAFKRIKNILRQAAEKQLFAGDLVGAVDVVLLTDEAEKRLYTASTELAAAVEELRAEQKYDEALERIASLRPHVDRFFDQVMVMAPRPEIRQNRLALIATVLQEFSKIADFSEIVAP
jgi:glycyl-tRNA synthetase beta chain